jgi:hypothetical protein
LKADLETVTEDLARRCEAIEESYEFMLAYASRGLVGEHETDTSSQIREYLRRFDAALSGLGEVVAGFVQRLNLEPAGDYQAFVAVLDNDTRAAQAALRLVVAQRSLSSQLVDNLNASIHLRTLLTDLFLIDEILKAQTAKID